MYVVGLEFVKDSHSYCPVSNDAQEGSRPVCTVAPAQRDFVPFFDSCVFEQDMHFFYLSGYIMILQCCSFVIGKSIQMPIIDDALLNIRVETWY
jgi:hypothetical protein